MDAVDQFTVPCLILDRSQVANVLYVARKRSSRKTPDRAKGDPAPAYLAGVPQPGGDAVYGQVDAFTGSGAVVAAPAPSDQLDLQVVQRFDVGQT